MISYTSSTAVIWELYLVVLMGVALALIHFMKTNAASGPEEALHDWSDKNLS